MVTIITMRKLFYSVLATVVLTGCSFFSGNAEYSRTDTLMGTFVQVKTVCYQGASDELSAIVADSFELARQLEKKLSIFNANSEINALNAEKNKKVSDELFEIIKEAKHIGKITNGEFDITVAPILKKQGFYKDMPDEVLAGIPDNSDGVGWKNVLLYPDKREIVLLNGAWLDLSGISKGYIVDKMSEFLRTHGVLDFLVNAGGEIYCSKYKRSKDWRIGVRKPRSKLDTERTAQYILLQLNMENMAVATSGDYENVIIEDNGKKLLSHIVDPSTEKALPELPSSVTVIAPECFKADALATGMMAMGKEKALELTRGLKDVEIIFVENSGAEPDLSFSAGVSKYVKGR
ncbi:MAG: FAD:protein FMN transferase [Candidatus Omnitrophota bacterium]